MEKTRWPGIFKRGRKYVAVVSFRDGGGAKRQRWITRSTQRAAMDARRVFLNDLEQGLLPEDGKTPLGEYLTGTWLPEVEATRRPLTVARYRGIVEKHILPRLGGVLLRDLNRRQLHAFYRDLPSPATAKYVHSVLSSALGHAVKDLGILPSNPCAAIRPPKAERAEARYLSEHETRRMLAVAEGHRLEAAIVLGLAGGLRRAEICAVRWKDVDMDTGILQVRESYWGKTKSGRVRGLTLPEAAVRALRRAKARQAQELLGIGFQQGPGTFIHATWDGGQVKPQALAKAFRRFCTEHRFLASLHTLRHTNASLLLASGADVKTVADRLGHANPSLLFNTYAHLILSADRAAAERLGAVLAEGSSVTSA